MMITPVMSLVKGYRYILTDAYPSMPKMAFYPAEDNVSFTTLMSFISLSWATMAFFAKLSIPSASDFTSILPSNISVENQPLNPVLKTAAATSATGK